MIKFLKGDSVQCSDWNRDNGVLKFLAYAKGTVVKVGRVWAVVNFPSYGNYKVKIYSLKFMGRNSQDRVDVTVDKQKIQTEEKLCTTTKLSYILGRAYRSASVDYGLIQFYEGVDSKGEYWTWDLHKALPFDNENEALLKAKELTTSELIVSVVAVNYITEKNETYISQP